MANQEHLDILKQGVEVWNQWREEHVNIKPDLSGADLKDINLRLANLIFTNLSNADLRHADLRDANLSEADLSRADLREADLGGADIPEANLSESNLYNANLSGADLNEADLRDANLREADLNFSCLIQANLMRVCLVKSSLIGTNLSGADLSGADLSEADLTDATLESTNFTSAILMNCQIFGISAWRVKLEGATQNNLVITPDNEPTITVDNLKIAQFIYLLLNNKEIRDVIDTITSKVVLILGRFTPERKAVLDAIRVELRKRNYSPVLFDFEKPANRDITETISTLAHMARFVIADLTDAKSIPQELKTIVPNLPSVPIQPLILSSQREYGMFEHFTRFPWVLPIYHYADEGSLLQSLKENIIEPAERKAKELAKR